MPDIHQGYGFPVGGVAVTEAPDGVASPGGVGYDINCGVRLLTLPLKEPELDVRREPLAHEIARAIPAGTGKRSELRLDRETLARLLGEGPRLLVEELGIGTTDDLEHTESHGCLLGAEPAAVSERALARGAGQVGTIGSGKHFIELQRVERVFDREAAAAFGLHEGQITVLIHSGSRGLGHRVCTDYVGLMDTVEQRYGICFPTGSSPARRSPLRRAVPISPRWPPRPNSPGRTAKQWRTRFARRSGASSARTWLRDAAGIRRRPQRREARNARKLLVHRKGATRAFPAGSAEIPLDQITGAQLPRELGARGIVVRCPSNKGLAEEAPFAYKDVERVVEVVERAVSPAVSPGSSRSASPKADARPRELDGCGRCDRPRVRIQESREPHMAARRLPETADADPLRRHARHDRGARSRRVRHRARSSAKARSAPPPMAYPIRFGDRTNENPGGGT
jgi:tRNA-splicing ligase RtcB